jgi:hypothetical protein
MSVKLAPKSAELANRSTRQIPWDSRAKFFEIGNGVQLSCSLRDCVAAFAALDSERRSLSMIISDELVPTANGGSATLKLDPADIAFLLDALPTD